MITQSEVGIFLRKRSLHACQGCMTAVLEPASFGEGSTAVVCIVWHL
jgi:hypothetical protein